MEHQGSKVSKHMIFLIQKQKYTNVHIKISQLRKQFVKLKNTFRTVPHTRLCLLMALIHSFDHISSQVDVQIGDFSNIETSHDLKEAT
jgi:hypothetical protein